MIGGRLAVMGTYRSGTSIVAAMLHHLGVDMGAPFWGDYYEPSDLSSSLRRWWSEPTLEPTEAPSNRVLLLKQWIESRGNRSRWVGGKHPLFCLSAQDLVRAWGPKTKFIWARRSLDESIASLEKTNWWEDPARIQRALYEAADRFFPRPNSLIVDFSMTVSDPQRTVEQLVQFLGLHPTAEQISTAVGFVHKSEQASHDHSIPKQPTQGKLVATVLSANSQSLIGDAIKSVVHWVDEVILLDTGIQDRSVEVAKEIAGEKLRVVPLEWTDDFGSARNQALAFAREANASWVVTVDTDERLEFSESISDKPSLLAKLNEHDDVLTWLVSSADGLYTKERWIRVGSDLVWRGRTHEALLGATEAQRRELVGVRFREIPKSPEAFRDKLDRDLLILRHDVRDDPENGRSWYYLGQTLANLSQHEGAITAFDRCVAIRQWDELAAWSCYMAAKSLAELGQYDEAIERCVVGLAVDAYYPELAWMCGWCQYKNQEYRQAIAWSRMAISLGCVTGIGDRIERVGFRDPIGWYEGPFDVLRCAHHALGQQDLADQATHQQQTALTLREASIART